MLSELKLENRSGSRLKRFGNGLIWLLSTARNAVVILICSIIGAGLVAQGKHDILLLTGNITAGLPSFQPPPFYIEYKNETFNFGEISQKLGSAIVIAPVIGILESVSIAKTFGTVIVETCSLHFVNKNKTTDFCLQPKDKKSMLVRR